MRELSNENLRLNEVIGDTYFFVYRVGGVFGINEQIVHLSLTKEDLRKLKEKGDEQKASKKEKL